MIFAGGPKALPIEIRIAVIIYVAYMLPYIMLSYYERYAVPLVTMKGAFLFVCNRIF